MPLLPIALQFASAAGGTILTRLTRALTRRLNYAEISAGHNKEGRNVAGAGRGDINGESRAVDSARIADRLFRAREPLHVITSGTPALIGAIKTSPWPLLRARVEAAGSPGVHKERTRREFALRLAEQCAGS